MKCINSFFNLFFCFSDTSVKYKTFTEISKISPNTIHTTNAVTKKSNINYFQNVYVIFSLTLLGVAIVMFPVVILIYKIITLRMRMVHFGQHNEKKENVVEYETITSQNLDSVNGRTERQDTENNHEYEEISSAHSLPISNHSNDACKTNDDYLTPISALALS